LSMVTRYANYLALDRHSSKLKVSNNNIESMKENLNNYRQIEKQQEVRIDTQQKRIELLERDREKTLELLKELMKKISDMQINRNDRNLQTDKFADSMELFSACSEDHSYQS